MILVECVPNISEGRRPEVYEKVAQAVKGVEGVTLLNVDPGAETNRTVITFVGPPEAVLEAAFQLAATAFSLIDMRHHKGAHPRLGAVDVVPFVPISGVSMEDCVALARQLGQRLGETFQLPVYLYEFAATAPHRKNLSDIRAGEYEGLPEKLKDPAWQPDFGPAIFNPQLGACVVGARKFLVAYNVNLNTTDKRLANRVALDVREKGRAKRNETGEIIRNEKGEPIYEPGLLKAVKAVGWTIPEYGCAQVSMNLTDLEVTPLHVAFDTCEEKARERGLRVTGSELVGLIPKQALLEAGRYYLTRMGKCTGVPEEELIHVAVRTLGLSEVKAFDPQERIIEYRLAPPAPLVSMSLRGFVNELSSESPAPGGGSVSALCAALGAALAAMVANLSFHKKGFEDKRPQLERIAVTGQELKQAMLEAVDEDTRAFNQLLAATRLPKATEEEREARERALEEATLRAIQVPLSVLESCPKILDLCLEVAEAGLSASLSDVGVGIEVAFAAASGAFQNVCINLQGLRDRALAEKLFTRAEKALALVREKHALGEQKTLEALRKQAKP